MSVRPGEADAVRTDRPAAVDGHETLPTVREVIGAGCRRGRRPGCAGRRSRARRPRAVGARLRQRRGRPPAQRRRAAAVHRVGLADRGRRSCVGSSDELVDAGLSGLVLELGAHHRSAPAVVIDAARDRGLALIVLHREVKFVSLTEAVHGRIISAQTEALRARDEVRERFTALSLRGAPADFIVHQLAQTLGAPVILENLAHEIVAGEVPPGPRGGAVHGVGAAIAGSSARRRARARSGARLAHRPGRGARHPVGKPHRAARPAAPRGPRRRARAGRDRARDRPARRR